MGRGLETDCSGSRLASSFLGIELKMERRGVAGVAFKALIRLPVHLAVTWREEAGRVVGSSAAAREPKKLCSYASFRQNKPP